MRKLFVLATLFGLFLLGVSSYSLAHEAFDPLHATPVEIIKSRLAYPGNVHVEVTDKKVIIKGILNRRSNIHRKSLRGHIDIELLDNNNQRINISTVEIKGKPIGFSRFDTKRKFTVTFPLPSEKDFSVRVKHSTKSMKSERHT